MKRNSLILAVFMAALIFSVCTQLRADSFADTFNVYATPPAAIATNVAPLNFWQNVPLIRQIPPLFLTTLEGTGTSTRFVEPIPLVWDSTSKVVYASGSALIFQTEEYGPSAKAYSVLLVASPTQTITLTSNVREILLTSSGTFELSIGTATFTANTPGIYNATIPCIPGDIVAIKTTATETYVGVYQFGR